MKLTKQEKTFRKLCLFECLESLVIEQARLVDINSSDALEAVVCQHKLYVDAIKAIKLAIGDDD